MTNTPKEIDKSVIDFCKSITRKSIPEYVELRPEPWCRENECYDNVENKVKSFGGKRQLGWRIQVIPDPLPKFMIEAVHHAIWISDKGEKIDITPQPASARKIVFVADDSIKLERFRIGEKYHALINCPIVNEYVRLCKLESTHYVSKTELINTPKIPEKLKEQQDVLLPQIMMKHGVKY